MDLAAINDAIAASHRGRRWILATDVAAAASRLAERLTENGAAGVMVVAAHRGVGDLPDCDAISYTGATGATAMTGIRAFLESVEQPSPQLLAEVEAFDPDRVAMVLGAGLSRRSNLCGRPVYGARKREWRSLEDKMIADSLWDGAGIPRAPSAVVPVAEAPSAAARLSTELGSVWVADNKEGWHGGGEYVRWVRGASDEELALSWLRNHADAVRVMPFLDGIPCSIHGFVTQDGVAVFSPFEMFILRGVDQPTFFYAKGGNYWNPPGHVLDEMRSAARSVGVLLRERFDYLGGFGIDGISTVDGFRPTELNPRLTIGHAVQCRTAEVPIGDIERMLLSGTLDIDAADLERAVTDAVRDSRDGGAMFFVYSDRAANTERAEISFSFDGDEALAVSDEGSIDGTMSIGRAAFGWVVIVEPEAERTPVGPSFAPRIPPLMQLARNVWQVDLPRVSAAPDLHAV